WAYTYDANGNQIMSVDPRQGSGTVYTGYDALNRPLWRNTANTLTGAYATYGYDDNLWPNIGAVGQLTSETFNTGDSLGAGSYSSLYDARGRQTKWTATLGGTSYPFTYTYDDADHQTSLQYSDNELLTFNYDLAPGDASSGWLTSATTQPQGGSQTNLFTAL